MKPIKLKDALIIGLGWFAGAILLIKILGDRLEPQIVRKVCFLFYLNGICLHLGLLTSRSISGMLAAILGGLLYIPVAMIVCDDKNGIGRFAIIILPPLVGFFSGIGRGLNIGFTRVLSGFLWTPVFLALVCLSYFILWPKTEPGAWLAILIMPAVICWPIKQNE